VITVRVVESDADIDTWVEVRRRVQPADPYPREVVVEDMKKADYLGLIAELDGAPVGAGSAGVFGGAPDGEFAFVSIRVVAEARRQGVGTALDLRCSRRARELGKTRLYAMARHDDPDSLEYFASRGFEEMGRMQDVRLDLSTVLLEQSAPAGIEIVVMGDEHERGMYEVALEADADIPSAVPIRSGTFEQWRERQLSGRALRPLSFVALEEGRVVGYAILGGHKEEMADHWMTGVARSARGRGVALALKQAQIAAAKEAGLKSLRTTNDLGNGPMRRVNEKLGYVRRFEWVHLGGPLLDARHARSSHLRRWALPPKGAANVDDREQGSGDLRSRCP
jgi:L-amino acid N-acyltransferase YncA